MSNFVKLDELTVGGQSANYPKSLTDIYEVREFIGRNGKIPSEDVRVGHLTLKLGSNYPSHSHPAPEVYIQLKGRVKWVVGDEQCVVDAVTAVNIPPNTAHSMQNIGKDEATFVYFWYTLEGNTAVLEEDAKLEKKP